MPNHKAIILAAGRGSRMGSLTDQNPKCLITLSGHPLLEWQIRALKDAGIKDIAVVRGYRAEDLDKYKEEQNLVFFQNEKWATSNMVTSLLEASPWLSKSPCIVSYSDIFYTAETVTNLIENDKPLSITFDPNWQKLWEARFENPLDDAETFKLNAQDQTLIEIGNKPDSTAQIEGQYMGLLKFTPESWKKIESYLNQRNEEDVAKMSMTALLQILIENDTSITAVPCEGVWGEADLQSDIAFYETKLNVKWN